MVHELSLDDLRPAGNDALILDLDLDLDGQGPGIAITLRAAGDMMHDRTRRSELLSRLGVGTFRKLHQIHSRTVVDAQTEWNDERDDADGLITRDAGYTLGVTVADCLPIFLWDRKTGAIGLVHSGWRGTGIVAVAISRMAERYDTEPKDLVAVVGPGIGSCCYNVPEERSNAFRSDHGQKAVVVRGGTHFLDLRQANVSLLEQSGVREVMVVAECTACTARLGSFRREGPEGYTHMLALIGRFGYRGGLHDRSGEAVEAAR